MSVNYKKRMLEMKEVKIKIKQILKTFLSCKKIKGLSIFSVNDNIETFLISKTEKYNFPEILDIFGKRNKDFLSYSTIIPPFFVFKIKNGKCIIGREEIFTNENKVLLEITSQKVNPYLNKKLRKIQKVVKLKGSVVNLSLSGLENNYYHFSVEYIARYYLLKKSKIEPDYYIYPNSTNFQKEYLALYNINKNKILNIPDGVVIQADELITTSLINNWEYTSFRGIKHYQKQYLPSWISQVYKSYIPSKIGFRKIFISRSKAKYRKLENEADCIKILNKYGFEVHCLENYSINQQIKLFSECSVLVALHGAGLINMSYCFEGIKILEIFPEYYHDHSFVLQALFLKHKYYYLIGKNPGKIYFDPKKENVLIDLAQFEKAIELILT